MNWSKKRKLLQPILIALICFAAILWLISKYLDYSKDVKESELRSNVYKMLIFQKSQLEKSLYSRIYFTRSIAAYVSINSDITNDVFEQLAQKFINGDTVISTMSLARNCVLSDIYPLKGHESAIGLDLLKHPQRQRMVERSILTKQAFITGPVELVEGGIAFISYMPIFTNKSENKSSFWGVTDIVIYRDKLFNEVKLQAADKDYIYSMKGYDGTGNQSPCFWGDSTAFQNNPVSVEILLPTGTWILAASPKNGWSRLIKQNESSNLLLYLSALIISLLIWLWARALIRIRDNEKELKALFGSMEDLIIEFNKKGEYVKIAPTNDKLLILPKKELLGKTLHEVFDKNMADFFLKAIHNCLQSKSLIEIDYQLNISGEDIWFRARISYMSEDSVMYLAQDNTQKKKAEEELLKSKQKLNELNNQKDKFFSIIAHDLRNPLGSFKLITKQLHESYLEFSQEERIEFLKLMKDSANNIYSLLENLLEWSRSQRGIIQFNPENYDLFKIVENTISLLKTSGDQKNIVIENNIKDSTIVFVEPYLITSVFRNLISNAIKFSQIGGRIEIGIQPSESYTQIYIKDNGIGMDDKTINKLFRIDTSVTNFGTAGEKGTGLGLILCKEFVEKHGGKIWVESKIGKGSTFYFSLQKAI